MKRVEVKYEKYPNGFSAVVNVKSFGGETIDKIEKSVDNAVEKGASGLILDLRGSVEDSTVNVSEIMSLFKFAGTRAIGESQTHGKHPLIPLTVLVSKKSSTTAVALAKRLQRSKRALVVGEAVNRRLLGGIKPDVPATNKDMLPIAVKLQIELLERIKKFRGLSRG